MTQEITNQEKKKKIQSRFFRKATPSKTIQLTERRLDKLEILYHHRLATTDVFQAVLEGSDFKIRIGLRELFDAGYVDRPLEQLTMHKKYKGGQGRSEMIYALADKGKRVLCEIRGLEGTKTELNRKNQELGETTIFHDVVLTKIWACLKKGLSERKERLGGASYNLIFWYQDRQQRDKLITKLAVKNNKTLTLIPDSAFKLQCPKSQYLFFVEYYRTRKGSHQNYLDHLKLYNLYFEQGHYKKYQVSRGFRVITLVQTRKIMENLINLIKKIKINESLLQYRFWFVAEEDIRLYRKEKIEGKRNYSREEDFESILEPIFRTPQDDEWHCLEE